MYASINIHMHDDMKVEARDLSKYETGTSRGPLVALNFNGNGSLSLFVTSHQQIDAILKALVEASKMIPTPAQVEA